MKNIKTLSLLLIQMAVVARSDDESTQLQIKKQTFLLMPVFQEHLLSALPENEKLDSDLLKELRTKKRMKKNEKVAK